MNDTIEVCVNGAAHQIAEDMTVAALLAHLGFPRERIAVELNRRVVRKTQWEDTRLSSGDRIEIVHFVGGG